MAHVLNQPAGDCASSRSTPRNREHGHHGGGHHQDYWHRTRKLILCFDGTGNKFHGDDSDSNILKIFRMLDSSASDQFQYYQPGIGTYVVSDGISRNGLKAKVGSWYQMAKDSAVGSSFDQHVVGGYRFLMRYYSPGDEIYMFGFSRGAYVARFLAEMLDYVGLLAHGNEEMVFFAWNSFSQWQRRRTNGSSEGQKEREEMYNFLKGFRETFSRPIRRIRFLGLFDTVNSVPRFETAWMQRSRFPFTARSSAKVIRHAVSIDERRAKFRQDLIYQRGKRGRHSRRHRHMQAFMKHNPWGDKLEGLNEMLRPGRSLVPHALAPGDAQGQQEQRGRRMSATPAAEDDNTPAPYRYRSRSRSRVSRRSRMAGAGDDASIYPMSDGGYESEEDEQDIDEVWFAGGHADIGGGWDVQQEGKNASHIPLVWMIREAMRAGLNFDVQQLEDLGCIESVESFRQAEGRRKRTGHGDDQQQQQQQQQQQTEDQDTELPQILVDAPSPSATPNGHNDITEEKPVELRDLKREFDDMLRKAQTTKIHDSLAFGGGLPHLAVFSWRVMEWMPFRRLDLRPDGTWEPIRWPLPRGEVRDVPDNVRVHGSVIRRMELDPNYRPGNLIVGGGGRGVRVAPEKYGMGDWICVSGKGDPIDEIWTKKPEDGKSEES